MNFPRYSELYSRFHGCTSYRLEQNVIVLDFADMPFNNWSILHFYKYDVLRIDARQAFVQAYKVFSKSEAPITVACLKDSWTALLGDSKIFMPMVAEAATFQLYATPYFVDDPKVVAEYLQGVARPATDCIFLYKNCIMYLDKEDLPYPGGCYFQRSESQNLYRICFLSNEPMHHVLSVASEWKNRRGVSTYTFLTKEVVTTPKMIPFQPVAAPFLPEERAITTGIVQKRLSSLKPRSILQDVVNSYYRSYLHAHNGTESLQVLQELGLVVEWPFRVTFEGVRTHSRDQKSFVALAINGHRPSKTLFVRYPYEVYTEFNEVPNTYWTPIHYVPGVLELPDGMEKVSINSVVVGYVYKDAFFCFNYPVLEGRPTFECSRNVQYLLSVCAPSVTKGSDVRLLESFQLDSQYSLHKVQMKGVPFSAWCVTRETSEYPTQRFLPKFVEEWVDWFRQHVGSAKEDMTDVSIVQVALTLARHKICFNIKIDPKAKRKQRGNRILVSDDEIELSMGAEEAEFVNSNRVTVSGGKSNDESVCSIM